LKFEIYNQKISNSEVNELQELRNKIKLMKDEEAKVITENNDAACKEKKKEYKIINIRRNTAGQIARNGENQYKNEIEKLESEKHMLLGSGTYNENDPLIQKIEMKLKKLYESGFN